MKKHKNLVGFQKKGITYLWCKHCEKKYEKFVSTEEIKSPDNGEMMYAAFNGIKWALKHGYTPIYKR